MEGYDRFAPVPIIGGGREIAHRGPSIGPVVIQARAPTSAAKFTYEHPDLDDDPQEDPFLGADLALAKQIAELTERHFPGHPFEVEVAHQYGVALISLPVLMGPQSRYIVHISTLKNDPGLKSIVKGCSEILERYQLGRSGISRDDFAAAIERSPPVLNRNLDVPE